MEEAAMGIVTTLVLVLGGDPGSPLDRALPEPVAIRIRMLGLREGMSEGEVVRRLGLAGRIQKFGGSFAAATIASYAVGETHGLTLVFDVTGGGPSKLSKASLYPLGSR
jgi:hypothetical protein